MDVRTHVLPRELPPFVGFQVLTTLPSWLPLSDDPIPVHTMVAKSSSPYKGKEGQPLGVARSQVTF